MTLYTVSTAHDSGTAHITTAANSAEDAIRLVMAAEGCPRCAILECAPAFNLTGQPKPVWQRGDFASGKATQRPLFSGLGCLPGQGDLFPTDGEA